MALLGVGVLIIDHWFSPWYPFLLIASLGVALLVGRELIRLCPIKVRPPRLLCLGLLTLLVLVNWDADWRVTSLTFVGGAIVLVLHEMAVYQQPGGSTIRLALGVWILSYIGLFGSCLIQSRWLEPDVETMGVPWCLPLALVFFAPKSGDIGAYFVGRYLGRTRFSPKLSPKKTWEGTLGGVMVSTATTVGLITMAREDGIQTWGNPLLFGLMVAIAGVLGDLAASLVKRDLGVKDAAGTVPGFGGVLDVIDSILFAAPVVYAWWVFVGMGVSG